MEDIYSVSSCVSEDFDDWINYWKHNGYWFFDSPKIIKKIAAEYGVSLEGALMFYYEVYEEQYDDNENKWVPFAPESTFETAVIIPSRRELQGYDVVSFSGQTCAECSPLSCNHMAEELEVNNHCLLSTLEEAKSYVESGAFVDCEPGPYRIFAVYLVQNA